MMFTTSSVFIDTSILIESIKGKRNKLLLSLLEDNTQSCFINKIVVSEFMYHLLKLNGDASPQSSQSSGRIHSIIKLSNDRNMIRLFHFLAADKRLFTLVPFYMAKYNLLPNDAVILATCKIHNINKLASHDSDFIIPCTTEGVELLTEE